jgi:hypothetical protein
MPQGTVTVGTSSRQVLAADPAREGLLVQNLSANDVYLSFGSPAVLGSGLYVPPKPAPPIILDGELFGDEITGAINAIASAAGSNVYGIDAVSP